MSRGLRGLPLRGRLALLTALAVAVAVAASALACWLLVRNELRDEIDNTLRSSSEPPSPLEMFIDSALRNCEDETQVSGRVRGVSDYFQVVDADGNRCVSPFSKPVRVQPSDKAVAAGTLVPYALHDSTTTDGEAVRVITRQTRYGDGRITVSVSRPLTEMNNSLSTLAVLLAIVAGGGVAVAGGAGLWVARSSLKPVNRLTEAVEHVARTEDLAVQIPVEGKDEIARLSQSFNSMTAALASSRELQQQLIADAGHELRTPLTSLRTNIELLARSEETGRAIPPDDRKALMASVKAQMTELASLIGDLQELSRPDRAAGGTPPQVVALHEIAGQALERARLRGPELTITAALDPWFVRGERAALERAIVNVLDNAVKFSPPGGTIEVSLSAGTLTVRDHGPGIPAEELPHVFDRFWRSPSARALPGSGLGLSIVARTVRQSGGAVALRPAPGGGTEAVVTLPGAPKPPPETPRVSPGG
ncbi:cell wall metabolism sensor histidine kinase WalK [Streptomyces sp. GC420]|uniref:sensor histidine kinase n=1 Tax=Streptomyces sp. GC420 TaxID=2697568 RepID=UPI0014152537|nr:HAMP domain-containing sensor histidine kinase [Streptomyces sp. GC420]NBM18265.1 HAMP domain-containing protein [Streptomyces sp. GC420]